ncbi:hypothetical protein ACL02T_29915 [Pseudonocardia sp. RS010]|uniref:hypothetical protein n=1 Tax=Pseudonocardia sp. RS010 TaxID=3385979 RepID=UPI0039A2CFC5
MSMRERELSRRHRALVRKLELCPPLDLDSLRERLSVVRGKPLVFVAVSLPVPGPSGQWVPGAEMDLVTYQKDTTPLHQEHIILHEIGHIICGHDNVPIGRGAVSALCRGEQEGLEELRASIEANANPDEMHRSHYGDAKEWEAETVATIIREKAGLHEAVYGTAPIDTRLTDLDDTLRNDRRWLL